MVKLPCVEMPNGMLLTLRERKIMSLMIAETGDRQKIFSSFHFAEISNLHVLIGDYIAAYKNGFIKSSDFERVG